MEARVAVLENGFIDLKASLARIEAAQLENNKELAAFRREMKETELPNIRAQLAAIDRVLNDKPSTRDFMTLASSQAANQNTMLFNLMKWIIGGFLVLIGAVASALVWLHSSGVLQAILSRG